MNKKDLLNEARKQGFYSPAGMFFNDAPLSADMADEKYAAYSAADSKTRSVKRALRYLGCAAIAAKVCYHYTQAVLEPTSVQNLFTAFSSILEGTAFFSIIWLALLWFFFEIREIFIGQAAIARALAPIAGKRECQFAALALNEGGPNVAAWRDLAVAERGALRVYDVDVMLSLRLRQKVTAKLEAQQKQYRVAYDLVHGTASPTA